MKIVGIALIFLLVTVTSSVQASTLMGRVVDILDGDTLIILDSGMVRHWVRLAKIDAPEKGQLFGMRAKASLFSICFGRSVKAKVFNQDRYGRIVAEVYCDGVDASAEQVKRGCAWVYRKYVRDSSLSRLEKEARNARRGLWKDTNPIPPWEYRKMKRRSSLQDYFFGAG